MTTGAVMAAAGMSSRMKSFKPMLQLGGSTVIRTAITTLQAAGIQDIAVVTGNEADQLSRHLAATGVTCLYNAKYASTDMFYSACIGLRRMREVCDRIFFLPADVPLFSYQSLFSMLGYMDCNDCEIVVPVYDGRAGHPILIDSQAIDFLTAYTGGDGLRGAIKNYPGVKAYINVEDAGILLDADKPEDYDRLVAYVRTETLKEPLQGVVTTGICRKQIFFDSELCELLHLVEQLESLHRACAQMGIAYSRGWRNIKIAEHQLGFPLLDSRAGGSDGGGSVLTDHCHRLIWDYERYTAQTQRAATEAFDRYFSAYQAENQGKKDQGDP